MSELLPHRSPELFTPDRSRVVLVDVQTKLLPHIEGGGRVLRNCRLILEAAELLKIPVTATEQHPRGLGPTVPELRRYFQNQTIPEKLRFSSATSLDWVDHPDPDRSQIVVIGIEGHVCVAQTVLDLLSLGYQVCFPADAIGSRNEFDWEIARQRLMTSGGIPTTAEALLFEWLEEAGTPVFKTISRLITDREIE